MDYFEGSRSQLRQGAILRTLPGAVRPNDPRWVYPLVNQLQGREIPVLDKLKILSGQDCKVYADADMNCLGMGPDLCDDFASDSTIRKLGRMVLWHCECLYYQLLGQWLGERVETLKQTWTGLPDRSCSTAR
jgi:hypothetical protein